MQLTTVLQQDKVTKNYVRFSSPAGQGTTFFGTIYVDLSYFEGIAIPPAISVVIEKSGG